MGFFDDLFSDEDEDKKEKKQKKKRTMMRKSNLIRKNRTGRIRSRSLTKMIRRMMTAKVFSPVFSTMMTMRK